MMNGIKVRLFGLLLASLLIGAFFVPVISAGGESTNWLDTFDERVTPRGMSTYNKPIVTKEPEQPGPEPAEIHPGLVLLGENVTFPDAGYVAAPGLPSGPTAHVTVADPAYFSPVPSAGEVNLTNLPPLRKYDLVTADPAAFVAGAGSGSRVTLRLPDREFVLDLEPVPGPVAEGARAFVKNESGTFEVALPHMWRFEGTVVGDPGSSASFTVGGDAILGTIRCGPTLLVIGQAGTAEIDGEQRVVHVIYDERDITPRLRSPIFDCCVPPAGARDSPDITENRITSLVKSLIDAIATGRT